MDSDSVLRAFLAGRYGLVVIDDQCIIRFMNARAADLLGADAAASNGAPCWRVLGLRTPSGEAHCGPDCETRRKLNAGEVERARCLTCQGGRGDGKRIYMFTAPLSGDHGDDAALVHLLVPAPGAGDAGLPEALEPGQVHDTRLPAIDLSLLTRREREVLRLMADGIGTKRIADKLNISPFTVRHHVQHILQKLDVHRRLDAVLAWIRDGS